MSWNWKRLLGGGLCAGFVFTLGGIGSALLMDLPATFARYGVEPSTWTAVLHTVLRFGLGFASVVVYAGMRDGLGPGPWTALRVGLLIWFVGYVPGSAVLNELGVLSDWQLRLGMAWGAAESVSATLLGAWVYRPQRSDVLR